MHIFNVLLHILHITSDQCFSPLLRQRKCHVVPYALCQKIYQAMMPGVHIYEAGMAWRQWCLGSIFTRLAWRKVAVLWRGRSVLKRHISTMKGRNLSRGQTKRAFGRANSAEHKQYSSIRPSKKSFIPMFRSSLQRKLEWEQRKLEREKPAGASSD